MTNYVVSSGKILSGVELMSGDTLTVSSGGFASAIAVDAGAYETVLSGGVAYGGVVHSLGRLTDSGLVSGTVLDGGELFVVASGASSATTGSGIIEFISGKIQSGSVLTATGIVYVAAEGGVIQGAKIGSGVDVEAGAGGSSVSNTVSSGGVLNVASVAVSDTVLSGGYLYVGQNGIATSETVSFGGNATVETGGQLNGATLLAGGKGTVFGLASGTVISSGGTLNVLAGGTATATTVQAGAFLFDLGSVGATMLSGGTLVVIGSTASSIGTVGSGALVFASGGTASGRAFTVPSIAYSATSGGFFINDTVSAGCTAYVVGGGTATGTSILSGGRLVVSSGAMVSLTTLGVGGTLAFDQPFAAGGTAVFNRLTGVLSVTEAGRTVTETLKAVPANAAFHLAANAAGGTDVTLTTDVPADFTRDDRSDLLVQNNDGTLVIERQSFPSLSTPILVGNPGAAWHAVGTADYNGDGQADILLQNSNGQIVTYGMNGTAIATGNNLGNPGAGWHVRGSGDFNGDGRADIVLGNDDGTVVIWTTDGVSVTGAALVGTPGAGWTVEGVADFNGDGRADLLLQNTNGQLVDYLMNGTAVASASYLGNPGAGWAAAGTGDYNGDGRTDILLHNDGGADVIWETNGAAVTSAVYVGNPGVDYTGVVAGVDLNGDGSGDLVIQRTDSTLVGYTLNASATITAGAVLGTPGAGWSAVGNDPVQFIDGTGSALNLSATAGADQFDLTSFANGLHTVAGLDPAQDTVALSVGTFANYAAVQANEVAYGGGTFIALTPGTTGAAVVIQGVTPDKLSTANFIFR